MPQGHWRNTNAMINISYEAPEADYKQRSFATSRTQFEYCFNIFSFPV